MSVSPARQKPTSLERFGVAVVTVLGLLSLAVALHIDEAERATVVVADR